MTFEEHRKWCKIVRFAHAYGYRGLPPPPNVVDLVEIDGVFKTPEPETMSPLYMSVDFGTAPSYSSELKFKLNAPQNYINGPDQS